MDKAGVQAHPATLVALVLFTLVSLGLGVVANLSARRGRGSSGTTSWGTGRSGRSRSP